MPLYGHELNTDRNAEESGFVKTGSSKHFTGAKAVRAGGLSRLAGISIQGRSTARHGDGIRDETGIEIGTVTSGSFAPSLGHAIALGYVRKDTAAQGAKVRVQTARQELRGVVVATPFYKNGTARRAMKDFLGG